MPELTTLVPSLVQTVRSIKDPTPVVQLRAAYWQFQVVMVLEGRGAVTGYLMLPPSSGADGVGETLA